MRTAVHAAGIPPLLSANSQKRAKVERILKKDIECNHDGFIRHLSA